MRCKEEQYSRGKAEFMELKQIQQEIVQGKWENINAEIDHLEHSISDVQKDLNLSDLE